MEWEERKTRGMQDVDVKFITVKSDKYEQTSQGDHSLLAFDGEKAWRTKM